MNIEEGYIDETPKEGDGATEAAVSETGVDVGVEEPKNETHENSEEPKKKPGSQRNRDKWLEEREQRIRLEERLKILESQNAKPATANSGPKPPDPDQFETMGDYHKAMTRWIDERDEWREQERKRQSESQKAEEEFKARSRNWDKKLSEARKKFDDFDEVIDQNLPISQAMQDSLIESDYGAEIGYFLAKNPDEAVRISELPPLAAAREIGKIEASIAKSQSKPNKTTQAPAPISPVSATRVVTGGRYSEFSDY